MVPEKKPDIDEILRKHAARIEQNINTFDEQKINYSQTYSTFKSELAPDLTRYERLCRSLG